MANAYLRQHRAGHPSVGIPVKPPFLATGVSGGPVQPTGSVAPTPAPKRALLTGSGHIHLVHEPVRELLGGPLSKWWRDKKAHWSG